MRSGLRSPLLMTVASGQVPLYPLRKLAWPERLGRALRLIHCVMRGFSHLNRLTVHY
jgi:hypothetical protein